MHGFNTFINFMTLTGALDREWDLSAQTGINNINREKGEVSAQRLFLSSLR